MTKPKPVRRALGISVVAVVLAVCNAAGQDQSGVTLGPRPARITLEFDVGAHLPGTLYNETISRFHDADTLGMVSTRTQWKEFMRLGEHARLILRVRPEGGAGIYVAGLWGRSDTEANYSGGGEAPETILRNVQYRGVEFGVTMKLTSWDRGRGLLDYSVGAIVLRHEIDTSPGHRDGLAFFGVGATPTITGWENRVSTAWGVVLGSSLRVPLTEQASFRTTFQDQIVSLNTGSVSAQERRDIRAISGRNAVISLRHYTAHHLMISVGIEYTVNWGRPRRTVTRAMPGRFVETEVAPAVANAMRIAAEGDTVAAIAALEHRVSVDAQDAFAWRELALLKAPRGEFDRSARDEVLATLERALNMNPGDTELLRAYGRIRGLIEREGRQPRESTVQPLQMSALALRVEEGPEGPGGPGDPAIHVGWAVRGLRATAEGAYRYLAEIDVFDGSGTAVPLRAGLGEWEASEDGSLSREGSDTMLPLSLDARFFLDRAADGTYTVRVRFTDLESGLLDEASQGFEIPGP